MKKRRAVLVCISLVFVAVAVVFSLSISTKPLTEKEKAEIRKGIEKKIEWGEFCGENSEKVFTEKLPIFEISKKNPFFRIIRYSERRTLNGYDFFRAGVRVEFRVNIRKIITQKLKNENG